MSKIGKLVVTKGELKGLNYTVKPEEEVSIGRNLSCNIPVPDIKLSRIHCIVRNSGGKFELLDNNSTNGTCVNQQKIDVCTELQANDIITIGDTEIQFVYEES
jgi:pSer/pThr/pTyr-binding forkhead associated (FHA) protein